MAWPMTIIDFQKAKKQRKTQKSKSAKMRLMCKEGRHKWRIVNEKQFDTKLGKLVTVYQCEYCDKQRVKAL